MAGMKISQLPLATSLANVDEIPIVQNGITKKVNFSTLQSTIVSSIPPADTPVEQVITLTGDATGSGTSSIELELVDTGIVEGEYYKPVLVVDSKGRLVDAYSMPDGVEKFVNLNSPTLLESGNEENGITAMSGYTLPPFTQGAIYKVSVPMNTTITLPSTADLGLDEVLTISVKVTQTATSTITWAGQNGDTVLFDDPTSTPAGAGKQTIYCFTKFSGETTWLASIVWIES